MDTNNLTPEQIERAKACETPEDLLALAEEEGFTLTDEMVAGISAGSWHECSGYCPHDTRA